MLGYFRAHFREFVLRPYLGMGLSEIVDSDVIRVVPGVDKESTPAAKDSFSMDPGGYGRPPHNRPHRPTPQWRHIPHQPCTRPRGPSFLGSYFHTTSRRSRQFSISANRPSPQSRSEPFGVRGIRQHGQNQAGFPVSGGIVEAIRESSAGEWAKVNLDP